MSLVPSRLFSYLSALSESSTNPPNTSYEMMIGKRFYRVVKVVKSTHYGFPPRRFVHSFVDMFTGDVFRAASWNGKANGVRYNLLDDESYQELLRRAEHTGLYLRMGGGNKGL